MNELYYKIDEVGITLDHFDKIDTVILNTDYHVATIITGNESIDDYLPLYTPIFPNIVGTEGAGTTVANAGKSLIRGIRKLIASLFKFLGNLIDKTLNIMRKYLSDDIYKYLVNKIKDIESSGKTSLNKNFSEDTKGSLARGLTYFGLVNKDTTSSNIIDFINLQKSLLEATTNIEGIDASSLSNSIISSLDSKDITNSILSIFNQYEVIVNKMISSLPSVPEDIKPEILKRLKDKNVDKFLLLGIKGNKVSGIGVRFNPNGIKNTIDTLKTNTKPGEAINLGFLKSKLNEFLIIKPIFISVEFIDKYKDNMTPLSLDDLKSIRDNVKNLNENAFKKLDGMNNKIKVVRKDLDAVLARLEKEGDKTKDKTKNGLISLGMSMIKTLNSDLLSNIMKGVNDVALDITKSPFKNLINESIKLYE